MTRVSEITEHWFGLCRKPPTVHTAPVLLTTPTETILADRPDSSGSGRIRLGVSIAAGSLKTMVRNRYLLSFSFLSGLVMFFLLVAKVWDVQNWENTLPFDITLTLGNSHMVFDPWLFLVETICLFCFTILLACLVLHRNGNGSHAQVTFREGFLGARTYAGPLAILSLELALIATVVFETIYQTEFFTDVIFGYFASFFWIPFEYVPYGDVSAHYISFIIIFINICLFLVSLWLVPVIVLKKRLIPALAESATLIKKTWHEMLGCILVYGTIVIGVAVVALVIGHLPEMLFQGYDATNRGYPLMMVLYYGFILACFILMAAGFTAAGVAIADLYHIGKSDGISGIPEGTLKKPEHTS